MTPFLRHSHPVQFWHFHQVLHLLLSLWIVIFAFLILLNWFDKKIWEAKSDNKCCGQFLVLGVLAWSKSEFYFFPFEQVTYINRLGVLFLDRQVLLSISFRDVWFWFWLASFFILLVCCFEVLFYAVSELIELILVAKSAFELHVLAERELHLLWFFVYLRQRQTSFK